MLSKLRLGNLSVCPVSDNWLWGLRQNPKSLWISVSSSADDLWERFHLALTDCTVLEISSSHNLQRAGPLEGAADHPSPPKLQGPWAQILGAAAVLEVGGRGFKALLSTKGVCNCRSSPYRPWTTRFQKYPPHLHPLPQGLDAPGMRVWEAWGRKGGGGRGRNRNTEQRCRVPLFQEESWRDPETYWEHARRGRGAWGMEEELPSSVPDSPSLARGGRRAAPLVSPCRARGVPGSEGNTARPQAPGCDWSVPDRLGPKPSTPSASERSKTKQTGAGFLLCNPALSKSGPKERQRWPTAGKPWRPGPKTARPEPESRGSHAPARRSGSARPPQGQCPRPQVSFHFLPPKYPQQVEGATREARNNLSQSFSLRVPNWIIHRMTNLSGPSFPDTWVTSSSLRWLVSSSE